MSNKLKANFTINADKVLKRVVRYAHIKEVIEPQLRALLDYKQPPLVEQVHPVIYWLHRYSDTSKKLLNELERILSRIQDYEFYGKDNLLSNFGRAVDKEKFISAYSELFLANFLIKNGIMLVEYAPVARDGKARADFGVHLGKNNAVMIELVTPDQESKDFESKAHFLFEKLERVQSGFSIEISGFESYDGSALWQTSVDAPSHKEIEEMITNFRKFASKIRDDELPKVLPLLCPDYPRIKITIQRRMPNYSGTFVALRSSRTEREFPSGDWLS
jgi:hypothetical protein